MSDKAVEEIVEEAKKPGVFNIVEVLKARKYPSDTVNVYLNDQAAYDCSLINERIKELESIEISNGFELSPELSKELEEKRLKLSSRVKDLEASRYVFTITGISEEQREELLEQAIEKFPIEYEEITKVEVESQDRNDMFTELIWWKCITKIEAPTGDIQEGIELSDVKSVRGALPIAAVGTITEAIEKLRVATAMFMMSVDEDFLAKS